MGATEAIEAISARAEVGRAEARRRWSEALPAAGPVDDWVDRFRDAGRLTVNFHPDRICRDGHSVAAGLRNSGRYYTQWVSGVSAGSRSAVRGGERERFERTFFAGAYDATSATSGEHPVYGALDLLCDGHGGAPRFGSSYLVLAPHVRDRVTLAVGDSHLAPPDVGIFDDPSSVLAGLAEQARAGALLRRSLGLDAFVRVLDGDVRPGQTARDLDGYIEVQVHGGLSLADDVEAIVLDPAFRGSSVEADLEHVSRAGGYPLRWHVGSELHVNQVPADFRGPAMPGLARRVARPDGVVDAAAIGRAAALQPFEEPTVSGDPADSAVQQLKRLWHTVLAFGIDAELAGTTPDPWR